MVDPVFIEQDPEPDLEAAIRRRSSQPILQTTTTTHQRQPNHQSIDTNLSSPLPSVNEKDFQRPPPILTSHSTEEYNHGSDEKITALPGGGSGLRAVPTPESVLGFPAPAGQNTKEGESQGVELNRAETNQTLPSVVSDPDGDSEAVPEITWKASFIVSHPTDRIIRG